MSTQNFLPKNVTDLRDWYENFQLKIGSYTAALALTPADTAAITNDYAFLQFAILGANAFTAEARERVEYRDILLNGLQAGAVAPGLPAAPVVAAPAIVVAPGIIPRIRALARRIKASPAYNDAMAKDLRLLGAAPVTAAKPKLTATARPASVVTIKYVKSGNGGVFVESQRGSETAWAQIGVSTISPYTDSRPSLVEGEPEVRRYRVRFFQKDVPVGDLSDVVTVTTLP